MKPGMRLSSAVCSTEVILIRLGSGPNVVECGGVPMRAPDDPAAESSGVPASGFDGGTVLGRRYVHESSGLQLLCVKQGAGTLSIDRQPLTVLESKKLPSSD